MPVYSKANSSWLLIFKTLKAFCLWVAVEPAFIGFHLCCWFTQAIFCFASLYIWKEFMDFGVLHSDFGLKAGIGESVNLLSQVKHINVGKWKHADSVLWSLGKIQNPCLLQVIIPITTRQLSWVHSPYCDWKTMFQLLLIYSMCQLWKQMFFWLVLQEIKQCHVLIKWTQHAWTHRHGHTGFWDLFMLLKLRALGQMIILRVGKSVKWENR